MKPPVLILAVLSISGWWRADYQKELRMQCETTTAIQAAAEPVFQIRRMNAMVAATQPERDWDRLIDKLAELEAELRDCREY